jgi:uncharacterized membrane protein
MRCPNCDFENPDGFQYCGSCGSHLGIETQEYLQPRRVTDGGTLCHKCRNENFEGAAYCLNCGYPLVASAEIDGDMISEYEFEPYLIFEHDDAPIWMWPLLARVEISYEQWRVRVMISIVAFTISFFAFFAFFGIFGLVLVLFLASITALLGYYTWKSGRRKARQYSY